MFFLYNLILLTASLIVFPCYGVKMAWTGKYRRSLGARFGLMPTEALAALRGSPRIWLHAVSVGEVTAAAPVVAVLRQALPEACIILSTGTETGQDMARRIVPGATLYLYYPLDFPWVVASVLDKIQPDLFVITETELWPNFLTACRRRRIPTLMINGRISTRSFRNYRATRVFWRRVLAGMAAVGVISARDGERMAAIGAPPAVIAVCGNAKYDSIASRVKASRREETERLLGIRPGEKVFVAGSTHEGEERIVLQVYGRLLAQHPDCALVLIPRHCERAGSVRSLAAEMGFADCLTLSELRAGRVRHGERVILVDVIGELFKIYSLATVVFCGGSLVPKGGQNLLEPAAWGKVILHGPSMTDFREETAMLQEAGATVAVSDEERFLAALLDLLADPAALARRGEAGRVAVAGSGGAARRYGELILKQLRPISPSAADNRSSADPPSAGNG